MEGATGCNIAKLKLHALCFSFGFRLPWWEKELSGHTLAQQVGHKKLLYKKC
jgi:hypothetical protein